MELVLHNIAGDGLERRLQPPSSDATDRIALHEDCAGSDAERFGSFEKSDLVSILDQFTGCGQSGKSTTSDDYVQRFRHCEFDMDDDVDRDKFHNGLTEIERIRGIGERNVIC